MRIAAFDDERLGVVASDDTVVDITDLLLQYEPLDPADLLPDLASHFDELKPELERRVAAGGGNPLADVRLRSPLTRPSKIICLMGNYREGTDRPLQILDLFFKSPEMISGPEDTVILPPQKPVVVRIPFDRYTGKFVFHCHILNHEDHGMMGLVDVVE